MARIQTQEERTTRDVLNLGCGAKKMVDALNVDSVAEVSPDRVIDLNQRPWPLADGTFREVHAYDVIEHLDNVIGALEEIHRVSVPGALVHITVPHFSCANAFTDPTHRHYFGHRSFHYLTDEHQHSHYSQVRFRRRVTKLIFHGTILNKFVNRMANTHPAEYERRWAWMFPAWFVYAQLEVVKKGES